MRILMATHYLPDQAGGKSAQGNIFSSLKRRLSAGLVSNFLSLFSVNLLNYLVPLLTVPYIARVIEPDKFGLLNYALVFASYFLTVTDYGFNLTATREISAGSSDKEGLSRTFSAVLLSKLLLLSVSAVLAVFLAASNPILRANLLVCVLSFSVVLNNVFFPTWFFTGMQEMKYLFRIALASKVLYVILVFSLIRGPGDYLFIPLIDLLITLLGSGAAMAVVLGRYGLRFRPDPAAALACLGRNFYAFLPALFVGLFTNSGVFVLGTLSDMRAVAYYSGAYKIAAAMLSVSVALSGATFPRLARLAAGPPGEFSSFLRKLMLAGLAVFLPAGLLVRAYAGEIVAALLGDNFAQSAPVLRVLAFLPLVFSLNNAVSVQAAVSLGMKSYFTRLHAVFPLAGVAAYLVLVPVYSGLAVGWVLLAYEGLMFCVSALYLGGARGILWRSNG